MITRAFRCRRLCLRLALGQNAQHEEPIVIRPLALAVVLRSGARGVRRDFGGEIARQPKMFKNGGQSFRCEPLHLFVLTLPYLPREKLRCLLVFDSLVREIGTIKLGAIEVIKIGTNFIMFVGCLADLVEAHRPFPINTCSPSSDPAAQMDRVSVREVTR